MNEISNAVSDRRSLALGAGSALQALPLALVGLLERRYLDDLNPKEWRFWLENEAAKQPWLHRISVLPRDGVAPEVLAQTLGACVDPGHATVLVLDASPKSVGLHIGLRRSPAHASWSMKDALTAQAAAFVGNIPGLSLAPPCPISRDDTPELSAFIDAAPCFAALTGSARPVPTSHSTVLERLIRTAGDGHFVLTLVAQAQPPNLIDGMLDAMRRLRSEVHLYTKRGLTFSSTEGENVSLKNSDREDVESMDKLPMVLIALAAAAQLGAGLNSMSGLANLSQPLATLALIANHRAIVQLRTMGEQHTKTRSSSEGGQVELLDTNAQACEQILLRHEERLAQGKSQGWWRMAMYVAADEEATLRRVVGAMRAMSIGEGPASDPVRLIGAPRGLLRDAMRGAGFISIQPREVTATPAFATVPSDLTQDSLSTLLTTEELAVLSSLPTGEVRGVARRGHATFAMSVPEPEEDSTKLGRVLDDCGRSISPVGFSGPSLNRNTLVTGIIGSGKSTTCKRLLLEAHKKFGAPFLVVEPVKTEYRQLATTPGLASLGVWTIGDDFGLPLRLNPLEPVAGFPVGRHIDLLKAVFNAAFPMFPGMSQILEEALVDAYTERGWSIRRNSDPRERLGAGELEGTALVPDLRDLLSQIDTVMKRKGYAKEVQSNLGAALRSRVAGLLVGQKGLLLDTRRSTPALRLFGRPAVIELQALGDDDEKAFVMAVVFVLLAEYAEMRQSALPSSTRGRLQHLTLIEEAHRLLTAARPGSAESADARGKAVSMFTDLLAELRAYGEGFVVADQIPTKLASETMKNTAVKIVHRLTAPDDRLAIAGCLDLNEHQERYLNQLPPGQAVLHDPNLGDALLVAVEPLPTTATHPTSGASSIDLSYLCRGSGCEHCENPCHWYDAVEENDADIAMAKVIGRVLDAMEKEEDSIPCITLDASKSPGFHFCALLASARNELLSRVTARNRAVGLPEPLRATELLTIERGLFAIAPYLRDVASGVTCVDTWQNACEGLLSAIADSPPLEQPGCAHCPSRCRSLPVVATLKDRAQQFSALTKADQDPGLRASTFIERTQSQLTKDPAIIWCLAIQLIGNHHADPSAQDFILALKKELLSS